MAGETREVPAAASAPAPRPRSAARRVSFESFIRIPFRVDVHEYLLRGGTAGSLARLYLAVRIRVKARRAGQRSPVPGRGIPRPDTFAAASERTPWHGSSFSLTDGLLSPRPADRAPIALADPGHGARVDCDARGGHRRSVRHLRRGRSDAPATTPCGARRTDAACARRTAANGRY